MGYHKQLAFAREESKANAEFRTRPPRPTRESVERACARKACLEQGEVEFQIVERDGRQVFRVHRGLGHGWQEVTEQGCTCQHFRAVCQPLGARCVHLALVELAFSADLLPADPEPYTPDEVRAEETLATLCRARMELDFPGD